MCTCTASNVQTAQHQHTAFSNVSLHPSTARTTKNVSTNLSSYCHLCLVRTYDCSAPEQPPLFKGPAWIQARTHPGHLQQVSCLHVTCSIWRETIMLCMHSIHTIHAHRQHAVASQPAESSPCRATHPLCQPSHFRKASRTPLPHCRLAIEKHRNPCPTLVGSTTHTIFDLLQPNCSGKHQTTVSTIAYPTTLLIAGQHHRNPRCTHHLHSCLAVLLQHS